MCWRVRFVAFVFVSIDLFLKERERKIPIRVIVSLGMLVYGLCYFVRNVPTLVYCFIFVNVIQTELVLLQFSKMFSLCVCCFLIIETG